MNFGQAVEALHEGKMIQRYGWNGKNLFVFKQIPSEISIEIVPKMQSLPDNVKLEFERRHKINPTHTFEAIRYSNQLAIVKPDNSINGWTPSPADSLAEDWIIYNPS